MELERERVIEAAVSITTVAGFVALLVAIGLLFNQSEFSSSGGLVLVGAIAVFVLVMALVGVALAYITTGEED